MWLLPVSACRLAAQQRGEDAVGVDARARAGQEALDLVEQRVLVADEGQVVVARQLDELRAGDQARDVAAFLDQQAPVARAMEDQRRHANRRQDVRDVDFRVHPRQRDGGAGLAPMRRNAAHQSRNAGSWALLGARSAMPTGPPQCSTISLKKASRCSRVGAHG